MTDVSVAEAAPVVDPGAAAPTTGETQPSFDDTLTAEIDRLFDAADRHDGASERATAQQRGPDGKFQASVAAEQAPPTENVAQEIPEPPESWATVKAHWSTLPPEVRQALIDRDAADQQSRTETGERLQALEALERVIGPRREALASNFTSAEAAIEQLFALSDFAGRDFPGFVRWMCAQRGMDPRSLIEQVAAQAPADPTIAALQREVATLKSGLTAREQAERAEQERQALTELEAFRSSKADDGKPLYPHFEAVKAAMGGLLRSGAATSLAAAYKMALAADDTLQARIAKEAEAERKKAEEAEAKERAAKAQRAVRADIRSGSGSSSAARASLDDTLRAEIDRRMAGAAA